jgi:hypothetical protein
MTVTCPLHYPSFALPRAVVHSVYIYMYDRCAAAEIALSAAIAIAGAVAAVSNGVER